MSDKRPIGRTSVEKSWWVYIQGPILLKIMVLLLQHVVTHVAILRRFQKQIHVSIRKKFDKKRRMKRLQMESSNRSKEFTSIIF